MLTQMEKRNQWAERIQEYEKSGQSVQEWCAANNAKPNRLWYWLRKQRGKKRSAETHSSEWLPVEVADEVPVDKSDGLVVRVGSISIDVRRGFDPGLLTEVVNVLRRSC